MKRTVTNIPSYRRINKETTITNEVSKSHLELIELTLTTKMEVKHLLKEVLQQVAQALETHQKDK